MSYWRMFSALMSITIVAAWGAQDCLAVIAAGQDRAGIPAWIHCLFNGGMMIILARELWKGNRP